MKSIIKYGITRSLMITIVGSTLMIIFSPWIIKSFSSEPDIQGIAVYYLRCISLVYPLIAIGMSIGRILQGMGKGLPLLIITSIRILLISAPLALFFRYGLGKPVEYLIPGFASFMLFWRCFGESKSFITEHPVPSG